MTPSFSIPSFPAARAASGAHRARLARWPLGVALALAVVAGAAAPAQAEPERYRVDLESSELVALLYKDGIAARMAHDHVIRAKRFSGEVRYDPDDPTATRVTISADATSLTPDEPEVVERYKVANDLDADDRADVEETLKGEDQLDVERYPKIAFETTAVRVGPKGETYLEGKLTLRGVTKPIRLLVELTLKDGVLRGTGSVRIKQSDFGYEPYSAFFGAVKVKDAAQLEVRLVAKSALASEPAPAPKPDAPDREPLEPTDR